MSKFFSNLFKGKKCDGSCSEQNRNGYHQNGKTSPSKSENLLELNGDNGTNGTDGTSQGSNGTSVTKVTNGCGHKNRNSDQTEGNITCCYTPTDPNGIDGDRLNSSGSSENESSCNGNGYQETSGISYMSVSKDDPYYKMDHPSRGKAIIFNFEKWDNTSIRALGLKPRHGSAKDKTDLQNCLYTLDFDVYTHDNLDSKQFWNVLDELRKEDHTDRDCLVVAIMTHGEKNHIYVKDGTLIPVNLIWECFEADKCPTLAGKPKIFIIQACRGSNYDNGHRLHESQDTITSARQLDVTDASSFSYVIPNAADIIVAFSCPQGQFSWRHPEHGSWFIQAICDVFNRDAYNMDVQALFTSVAREVALNKESTTNNVRDNKKKQVTSTTSTLIRFLKFRPKASAFIPIHQNRTTEEMTASLNINNIEPLQQQRQQELTVAAS